MAIIDQFLIDIGLGESVATTVAMGIRFILAAAIAYGIGILLIIPLVKRTLDSRSVDYHARVPILKISWIVIIIAVILVALGAAGFGNLLLSFTAIAAAATLAIGFALQDVMRNFISGIFIFSERPFRIGDWIEWEDNSGIVEDISLRVTRVRTFDNELMTVPNVELTENVVKNPVESDQLRLKFIFGIGYDSDIDRATDIILDVARAHHDVLDDPSPSIRLHELGDSSVGLQLRVWIGDPSRADVVLVRSDLTTDVKTKFEEEDIEIPYPTRDIVGGIEIGGELRSSSIGQRTD